MSKAAKAMSAAAKKVAKQKELDAIQQRLINKLR